MSSCLWKTFQQTAQARDHPKPLTPPVHTMVTPAYKMVMKGDYFYSDQSVVWNVLSYNNKMDYKISEASSLLFPEILKGVRGSYAGFPSDQTWRQRLEDWGLISKCFWNNPCEGEACGVGVSLTFNGCGLMEASAKLSFRVVPKEARLQPAFWTLLR